MKAWTLFWAYLFVILAALDRFGEWLEDQVDNNDYLAGALGALALIEIPYLVGIIDIVFVGG